MRPFHEVGSARPGAAEVFSASGVFLQHLQVSTMKISQLLH